MQGQSVRPSSSTAAPPKPVPLRPTDFDSPRLQYRLVEVQGIVRSAGMGRNDRARLNSFAYGREIDVSIRETAGFGYRALIDSAVRVTGVLRLNFSATGAPIGAEVASQSTTDLQILLPAPVLEQIPWRTVSQVQKRVENHRVRLRGSVSRGGTGLIFRDATGNIPLIPSPERDVPQGDGVDIAAFVSAEDGGPVLIEAAEIDDAADKPDIRRVLTTVGEIQRLSTVELSQGYEADLQGVVTYSDRVARDTFIQDETGGIYVFPPSHGKLNLKVGQFVRLRGFIDPGAFAPAIVEPKGEVLGHRSMPTPLPLDMEDLLTGVADSRWVEVQGTVRAASAAERWPGLPMRIALLSSMRERGDDERSKASNIGAYLSKPVKNSDLRETIRKLLSAPAAPAVAGRHEPHLPAVSQQLRILLADVTS